MGCGNAVCPVIGMGFRGKIFGHLVYDGIEYDGVNHQVRWLGEPTGSPNQRT
jgi:hypothetical protein